MRGLRQGNLDSPVCPCHGEHDISLTQPVITGFTHAMSQEVCACATPRHVARKRHGTDAVETSPKLPRPAARGAAPGVNCASCHSAHAINLPSTPRLRHKAIDRHLRHATLRHQRFTVGRVHSARPSARRARSSTGSPILRRADLLVIVGCLHNLSDSSRKLLQKLALSKGKIPKNHCRTVASPHEPPIALSMRPGPQFHMLVLTGSLHYPDAGGWSRFAESAAAPSSPGGSCTGWPDVLIAAGCGTQAISA